MNQWWNPLKASSRLQPGGCGPSRQRTRARVGGLAAPTVGEPGRPGGHEESLRRTRGEAVRGKAGRRSCRPISSERGNHPVSPSPPPGGWAGPSSADGSGWGGAFVVLAHLMRRKHGGRRARVRGQTKVDADFSLLAAAVNLARLAALGLTQRRNRLGDQHYLTRKPGLRRAARAPLARHEAPERRHGRSQPRSWHAATIPRATPSSQLATTQTASLDCSTPAS
jgi:hypothetical protein